MLMSVINMKLRDFYPSLDALCDDMELDRAELEATLKASGFEYNKEHNTNKSFKDWLRRIDTYELLNTIRKEKGLLLEPTDNFVEDFNKHGDIPEVFIKIKKNEYLVNGALLHDILM